MRCDGLKDRMRWDEENKGGRRRGKRKRRPHSSDRSLHVAKQHRLDCDPGPQNDSYSDNPEQGDSDVLDRKSVV